MIEQVKAYIEDLKAELITLSEFIYENPELGYQEVKSARAHIELLKKHGFIVQEGYLGMATAFRAERSGGKPGPTVAFLAEYDALPGIGHGCGHNILGTTSTGAGIVLSKLLSQIGGKVVVFGTPAEETSGAKVPMAKQGAFADVDVAMMVHPADKHTRSGRSLALEAIQFTYKGRTAHAASSPEKGINALDACINTFNNINALREHIKSTARIHGIIVEGGKAANIVPELAIAQFYVRATTTTYRAELVEKVKNCARGASLAAGTELEITNYETSYDNLITNETLMEGYARHLHALGVEKLHESRKSFGSVDMGNVSHVCPAIHPYFAISEEPVTGHTREFAVASKTSFAYNSMAKAIGALALTGADVIRDQEFLTRIKEEFQRKDRIEDED